MTVCQHFHKTLHDSPYVLVLYSSPWPVINWCISWSAQTSQSWSNVQVWATTHAFIRLLHLLMSLSLDGCTNISFPTPTVSLSNGLMENKCLQSKETQPAGESMQCSVQWSSNTILTLMIFVRECKSFQGIRNFFIFQVKVFRVFLFYIRYFV